MEEEVFENVVKIYLKKLEDIPNKSTYIYQLMKKISKGRYIISLEKTEEYLSLIKGIEYVEIYLFKKIISEAVLLDISLAETKKSITGEKWDRYCEAAYIEATSGEIILNREEDELGIKRNLCMLIKSILGIMKYCSKNMNEDLFVCLMEIFEEYILCTKKIAVTQFVVFLGVMQNLEYRFRFISFLTKQVFNIFDQRREMFLIYLLSFLASSKEITEEIEEYFNINLLPAAEKRVQMQKDKLSIAILGCLMHISVMWDGDINTDKIDEIIMSVKDKKMLGLVDIHIQEMYCKKNTEYKVQKNIEFHMLVFPFKDCMIPQLIEYFPNYRESR